VWVLAVNNNKGGKEMEKDKMPPPITKVRVKLIGFWLDADGVKDKVSKALREAGYDEETVRAYNEQASYGDFDDMAQVTALWVHVI